MDNTVMIALIFALIVIFTLILFRRRIEIVIKGLLGTEFKVSGENNSANQTPGVKAKGITSQAGGVLAQDSTGRGIDVENIVANKDVVLSNIPTSPEAKPLEHDTDIHAEQISSGRDTFIVGQYINTIAQEVEKEITISKIAIIRVSPLINEQESFSGYEVVLTNENLADAWINSTELKIEATKYEPCSGNLNVLNKYTVHLSAKGEAEYSDQQGTLHKQKIGGLISEETETKYRIEGSLLFTDDCAYKRWLVQIKAPVNVCVPAQGRARFQLYFCVDESLLVEIKVSGSWRARTSLRFEETDKLSLDFGKIGKLETSFEGELAALLINQIVAKTPKE